MIQKELCKVLSQKEIASDIFELIIHGDLVSQINAPGQFVHLKVSNGLDPLLRRPISISSYDTEQNSLTMIYRKEGKGTSMLAELRPGMHVDILGPLGNGFPVEEVSTGDTALLVGGGIGVPPLYELSNQLVAKGVKVIHVLGFQTVSAVFYEEEFLKNGETYVATVDGSYGRKGFVTDVMKELQFDCIYTCGPTPMLRAIEQNYQDKKVFLSLEERMGCGIGACFACVCKKKNDPTGVSYKKVCSDGPVFRAGEVLI
ncbi:dihydroorotate dehydrogenase electron transfer subunit [Bacillus sp. AFS076308]|uniref:dihydroorotate dehydrogenase electron transfer subunit n=1 Tax=unclassified Bacillus (in: firmicutes) TaxID=185979 RepID=UPI000BF5B6AD|nr:MULTISPECIES: dihydroorotate dehydrogenase electron transfer subunit [unclassified Bacillus (in: firmicutes)]PFO05948.1 dihydroorotate dehydrogenase electron transfer subunit [Bacillus sp. AFS076308]PGV48976.1 dihydroorotate dehydrogenase electron transfer subunit [Bacillus sp. AFS037270]